MCMLRLGRVDTLSLLLCIDDLLHDQICNQFKSLNIPLLFNTTISNQLDDAAATPVPPSLPVPVCST